MIDPLTCKRVVAVRWGNSSFTFHVGECDDGLWRFCDAPLQGAIDISHVAIERDKPVQAQPSGLYIYNGPTPPSDWFSHSFPSKDAILAWAKAELLKGR